MAKSAVATKARKERNELQKVTRTYRASVRTIGMFSLVINLLMLANSRGARSAFSRSAILLKSAVSSPAPR